MPPKPLDHAALVVVSPKLWSTYAVFNANAFPEDLSSIVESCSLRLGMLVALSTSLSLEVEREWQILEAELHADRGGLLDSVLRSEVPIVAYADGLQYLGTLYSYLATVKSFLDVYALLIGKTIGRNLTWTFKKGRVAQDDISGGSIVNWLHRSAPKTLISSRILAEAIERHSRSWITETVHYRDTISHYSEIPRMRHLSVPLRRFRPIFDRSERILPALPNGKELPHYATDTLEKIRNLVVDTIAHLPSINMDQIHPDRLLQQR